MKTQRGRTTENNGRPPAIGSVDRARYAGQGVDVDDLVQEASLGLAEAAKLFDPKITPPDHFGEYARAQVTKRVIQAIDAELQNRTRAELPDIPAPTPDQNSERAADELWSAAEVLSEDDRELLADRYGLDGRPAQGLFEICSRRNLAMSTLKRRLDDIRRRLKLELVQRGWRDRGGPTPVRQAQLNIG